MPEVVLAVDVGGTKMALALVDDEGAVLAEDVRPTPDDPDPLRVVGPLLDGVEVGADQVPAGVELRSLTVVQDGIAVRADLTEAALPVPAR